MTTPTLFGIKNCDTVRKARKWLDSQGIDYTFHDFRSDGLPVSTLAQWLDKTDVATLVNKRSTTWKQLSESEREQLFNSDPTDLLQRYPTLIKRPVLVAGGELAIGFNEQTFARLTG